MDEYFKQINRCSNNVRLDQGGPMRPHEVGHIFEDLAWLVMVDKLAIHFDDFQFRSSEFRDLAKVLKDYQDIRMFRAACGLAGTGNETHLWGNDDDNDFLNAPDPMLPSIMEVRSGSETDIESPRSHSSSNRKVQFDSQPAIAGDNGDMLPDTAANLKSLRKRSKKESKSHPPKKAGDGARPGIKRQGSFTMGMKPDNRSSFKKRASALHNQLKRAVKKKNDTYWYVVCDTSNGITVPVRTEKSLGSKLEKGSLVYGDRVRVVEKSGRHLRIEEPYEGWVSWAAVDGGELLKEEKKKKFLKNVGDMKKTKSQPASFDNKPSLDDGVSSNYRLEQEQLELDRALMSEEELEEFLDEFRIGDLVEVKQFEIWRPGMVTQRNPLKVQIKLPGWNKAFMWPQSALHIRTLQHMEEAEYNDYVWPEGEEMSPRAAGGSIGSFASFSTGSYREAARQDSVRRRQQSNQAKQRQKRIQHPTPPAAPDTSHPQTFHPGANIPPP